MKCRILELDRSQFKNLLHTPNAIPDGTQKKVFECCHKCLEHFSLAPAITHLRQHLLRRLKGKENNMLPSTGSSKLYNKNDNMETII